MELKDLVESFKSTQTAFTEMQEKHDTEMKEMGSVQAETKAALELAETKMTEALSKFDNIDAELKKLASAAEQAAFVEAKSWGQQFVESEKFLALGGSDRKGFGAVNAEMEQKDITGTVASAMGAVQDFRDPTTYRTIGGMRALRIRDLLPTIPVNSGAVEIMRITSVTNNAAPQGPAAGTAQGAGELVTKAKSNLVIEAVTVAVRTIAHYVIASRQVLTDAPQLKGIIDGELNYGLDLESDEQLLNGSGTNQDLTGLMVDAAVPTVGEIASGTTAAELAGAMIDHIRAAITECQTNEYYNINGLILNPVDWQTLETAKATDGHFLLVAFAATAGQTQTIWRVPVVVSNAMTAGVFLLGDFQMGATIYDREQANIRVSESHADLFIENGVAVLAEERYCLGINRPLAFCKGSFAIAA